MKESVIELFDEREVRLMKMGNGDVMLYKGRITNSCCPSKKTFDYCDGEFKKAETLMKDISKIKFDVERLVVYQLGYDLNYKDYKTCSPSSIKNSKSKNDTKPGRYVSI